MADVRESEHYRLVSWAHPSLVPIGKTMTQGNHIRPRNVRHDTKVSQETEFSTQDLNRPKFKGKSSRYHAFCASPITPPEDDS